MRLFYKSLQYLSWIAGCHCDIVGVAVSASSHIKLAEQKGTVKNGDPVQSLDFKQHHFHILTGTYYNKYHMADHTCHVRQGESYVCKGIICPYKISHCLCTVVTTIIERLVKIQKLGAVVFLVTHHNVKSSRMEWRMPQTHLKLARIFLPGVALILQTQLGKGLNDQS